MNEDSCAVYVYMYVVMVVSHHYRRYKYTDVDLRTGSYV